MTSSTSATSRSRASDVGLIATPNSPSQHGGYQRNRTLHGRNCLLGSLLESTFTSITVINDDKAIVCTDNGDICLLDNVNGAQKLYRIKSATFTITAVSLDTERQHIYISGLRGNFMVMKVSSVLDLNGMDSIALRKSTSETNLKSLSTKSEHADEQLSNPSLVSSDMKHYIALAPIEGAIVAIDNHRAIRLLKFDHDETGDPNGSENLLQQLLAHRDGVLGVKWLSARNYFESLYYTWSVGGSVLFWGRDGICKRDLNVDLENGNCANTGLVGGAPAIDDCEPNELRAVNISEKLEYLVAGDRRGVIKCVSRIEKL